MLRRLAPFVFVLLLAGCGDEAADDGALASWRHVRLEGLQGASAVTVVGDDLVFVCGGNDRDVYTISRRELESGGRTAVRRLAVTIAPSAPVQGSSPFAHQSYTLEHLWKVPVDFQGLAFQPPDFLYVGEAKRRLLFWGRLRRDAAGGLAAVKLDHVSVLPGAKRSKADAGDWGDHGAPLRGLVAVKRPGRMEDLWVVDAGTADGPVLVRRTDRYGSNLQGLRVRHGFEAGPDVRAVSFEGRRLVVLHGDGRGRLARFMPPPPGKLDSLPDLKGVPGPEIAGAAGWTGMAHAADGMLFLVSGDAPAVLAWRMP